MRRSPPSPVPQNGPGPAGRLFASGDGQLASHVDDALARFGEHGAMLACDTSGLLAYFDARDAQNGPVSWVVETDPGPFVVSPYVLAELDYLLATRREVEAELAALAELSGGAWDLPSMAPAEVRRAVAVIERYQDQEIGLADASLVVLAHRYRTDRILSLDHRHFRVIRTVADKPLRCCPPADAGHRADRARRRVPPPVR